MKKNKKILSLIMSVMMISLLTSIGKTTVVKASEVSAAETSTFAKGADTSWLPQMEASGFVFKNDKGDQEDCLQILKKHGINSIRLRTWVNPSNDRTNGHCSTKETVTMAVRAKQMGFRIMLDFHYSDTWADPSHQDIPEAWKNDTLEQMKTHLYNYTYDVMTKLKDAGVTPEWVQVGNEINSGMLLPMGSTTKPDNLVQLINSGYDAVKAVSPTSKVILQRANGYENANFRNFFDALKKYGTKYDVIGVSYYPSVDYTSTIDELGDNLKDMAARYGKEVMVVEVGADCSEDEVNVHNMLVAVQNKVLAVPDNKGLGVFYWEPEGAKSWSGYSMSAWNGYDGKANDGQPTKALDAFLPGEAELNPYPVTEISFDKKKVSVEVGNTLTLKASLTPSNSTYKGIIFSSSKESVAKINSSTGIVTGIAPGTATITATSYDQHKTAVCKVTVTKSSNLIKNPGFELDEDNWTVAGNSSSVTFENDAHTGNKALHYYNGDFKASQTITGLKNGFYRLTAWASGGGGEKTSEIFAVNGAKKRSAVAFTNTGWNIWNKYTINNVEVKNGKLTVGVKVQMSSSGGQWGNIDDFVLTKNNSTSLKDLKVNGTTVNGFDPEVTSYNVTLPAETTKVPKIKAAVVDSSAKVVVKPAKALPGKATVTVKAGSKRKVYVINFNVEKSNPVKNAGFEAGFDNWTISDTDAENISKDVYSGSKALGYWKASAYKLTVSQKITGLKNGVYTLSAWSQGAAESCTNQIFAVDSKGKPLTADIKNTGWAVWSQVKIINIVVTDGTLTIGSYLDAPAGYWGSYDDFELTQTSTNISN
ncbi:glycosyl hydrolase 53 family protein [Clostridium oryzae]|uniref:Arabinogalactan endo-beta-1,4-galactanase n=1 Tax=Clostridium oryzae TaxID=1450648 RepID=A0A1V4IL63_9CLOT|nr:glycosyl hydrolase 53 family protein [Clostridium oryzae]OPJ60207.1 arabinogalactan endo-1,4-beta-galactosidase precursor [Clostridium oryzae]